MSTESLEDLISATYTFTDPNGSFPELGDFVLSLENGTSSTTPSTIPSDGSLEGNTQILPLYQEIIWCLLYGLMVAVAAGGNLIVIWIVLVHRRMRTVTNYFIVNLSIADTMVSTLNVIFNFVYMLSGNWPFGEIMCKITSFISILSVCASVSTLMAISIDRYTAIMYPLKPRMSRKTTVIITMMIWVVAILVALPYFLYSVTEEELFPNGDSRFNCYLVWPDGKFNVSKMDYIYNVVILLVTYVVPILSMSFTYSRVGRELWGSQSIGEATTKQIESVKSKRKIVKMMIVVVLIFGICWLPYHVYFLLTHHYPDIIDAAFIQNLYLTIYFLAMSNSMYNPIIYCWMNGRFREGFKEVFCCLCFREDVTENLQMIDGRNNRKPKFSCTDAVAADTRVRLNGAGGDFNLKTLTESVSSSPSRNTPNLRGQRSDSVAEGKL